MRDPAEKLEVEAWMLNKLQREIIIICLVIIPMLQNISSNFFKIK